MEVHHHSHTARKKFTHYFFEFFMLFFAVFCGFLAEYYLETRIEKHREHQFVASMVADLKKDTASITAVQQRNLRQGKGLDSLLELLYHPQMQETLPAVAELYQKYALSYYNVVFSDRTISQLKNSGGMRLIRNQKVSDAIMTYDAGVQRCKLHFSILQEIWKTQSDISFSLFNLAAVMKFTEKPSPILISNDTRLLQTYANNLLPFSGVVKNYATVLAEQNEEAKRTLAVLQQEYDLD